MGGMMLSNSLLEVLSNDASKLIAMRQELRDARAHDAAVAIEFDLYQRLRGLEAFELWC